MVIIYTNQNEELQIQIGIDYEKSISISIMDLIIHGLKNILKKHFTNKEIKENLSIWISEIEEELILREVDSTHNQLILSSFRSFQQILSNFPESNHQLKINNLCKQQENILNQNSIDYSFLFNDVFFDNVKLSFENQSINHQKQKHQTSCTIACLAMLSNRSYNDVFKEIKNKYKLKNKFYTGLNIWKDYLVNYGLELDDEKNVFEWKDVPDFALCIVQGSKINKNSMVDFSHAIIVRKQHGLIWILDPYKDKIIYDFWNYPLSLKSYYEIKKSQ